MKLKIYNKKQGESTLIHPATSYSPADIPLNKFDVHFYEQQMKYL